MPEKHVAEMTDDELVERFKSCHSVWKSWEADGSFDDRFKSWRSDIQIDIDEWHERAFERRVADNRRIRYEKARREKERAGPWESHVIWAKERAFDLLNRNHSPEQAIISINNDLPKHPESDGNPLLLIVMLETVDVIRNGCKVEDVRNLIDRIGGFVPTDFQFYPEE